MSKSRLDSYLSNNLEDFIANDPISIPHLFSQKQDIEIIGFFAAIFAWGRRDIIISKAKELVKLMENQPYQFVLNYSQKEKSKLKNFKHRTFNANDLDFYLRALQFHYTENDSLESAFYTKEKSESIEPHLTHFYQYFRAITPNESRNFKHISTPEKNAACKRLCMYLRWMVRHDEIDFGIWTSMNTSQLVIPLDVHVMNVAAQLNLIDINDKPNWKTAIKLTEKLKKYDSQDPVKYDLALFSMGIDSKSNNL